jgi:hypothetical protein
MSFPPNQNQQQSRPNAINRSSGSGFSGGNKGRESGKGMGQQGVETGRVEKEKKAHGKKVDLNAALSRVGLNSQATLRKTEMNRVLKLRETAQETQVKTAEEHLKELKTTLKAIKDLQKSELMNEQVGAFLATKLQMSMLARHKVSEGT